MSLNIFNFNKIFFYSLLLSFSCFFTSNPARGKVHLERVFKISFDNPLFMLAFPIRYEGLPPLYAVVEQGGVIKLAAPKEYDRSDTSIKLLDMKKNTCSGGEQGLLGAAFSSDFKTSGLLYIYYSKCSPRRTLLSRIRIIPEHNKKIKDIKDLKFQIKEEILLTIRQPYSNHNGGMIAFGPDGYLYMGVGDGGSAGDPHNHAQNLRTLLGSILRIDVNTKKGYSIPRDNPFVSHAKAKPEIYAYGMRNPWRFSFDRKGRLIVADVGQNRYEEVHIVRKGLNYGWNILEGSHCYKPFKNCSKKNLEIPILEYSHREGQSIVGGYVYYGKISWLKGRYVFGDTVAGKIWDSDLKKRDHKILLIDTDHFISSFATRTDGEIYVIDLFGDVFILKGS